VESWKVKNKKLNFSYGYMLINFILFFFPVIMNLFLMDGKVDLFLGKEMMAKRREMKMKIFFGDY
jgi:hypothetical protein